VYLYAPGCIGCGGGTAIEDDVEADDRRFLSVTLLLLPPTPLSFAFLLEWLLLATPAEPFPADLVCDDDGPLFTDIAQALLLVLVLGFDLFGGLFESLELMVFVHTISL
jgi:hypothetical protein